MPTNLQTRIAAIKAECEKLLQNPGWVELSPTAAPDYGVAVLGFNESWIDADFNPQGIRECVRNDHQPHWNTSAWDNDYEQWDTTENEAPTHWMSMPSGPGTRNVSPAMARVVLIALDALEKSAHYWIDNKTALKSIADKWEGK